MKIFDMNKDTLLSYPDKLMLIPKGLKLKF